jgi:hypothetical protein
MILDVYMDVYADNKGKFLGRSGINSNLNKSEIGGRFNTSSQIGGSSSRFPNANGDSFAESSNYEDSVL